MLHAPLWLRFPRPKTTKCFNEIPGFIIWINEWICWLTVGSRILLKLTWIRWKMYWKMLCDNGKRGTGAGRYLFLVSFPICWQWWVVREGIKGISCTNCVLIAMSVIRIILSQNHEGKMSRKVFKDTEIFRWKVRWIILWVLYLLQEKKKESKCVQEESWTLIYC